MVTLEADSQKMYLDNRIILQIWVLQGYPDKKIFWTRPRPRPPTLPPTRGGQSHGYAPKGAPKGLKKPFLTWEIFLRSL